MRFEESGGELKIIKPGAERVAERQTLLTTSALIGAPGTAFVSFWWLSGAAAVNGFIGVAMSLLSAWTVHRAQRMGDEVWTLTLNSDKKTVERGGRVIARFEDVRAVRCTAMEETHHLLTLVAQHERSSYEQDILLCHMIGAAEDHAVFEKASVFIAEALGVPQESCGYAKRPVNGFR